MAKLSTRKRYFDLVGEGHDNPDGSSRQGELLQCEPGEEVTLRPEPDNAYDPNAIAVDTERGVCIGYLAREDAAQLSSALAEGRPHRAMLHQLRGGVSDYPSYGARIEVAWDSNDCGDYRPLDAAQERSRKGRLAVAGRERHAKGRLVGSKSSGCAVTLVMVTTGLVAGAAIIIA